MSGAILLPPGAGGGSGVSSVTAGDTSIVIGGTASAPTVETATLDVIAADHPPAAAVAMNGQKITGLAPGSASTDAATYGQTAAGGTIVSGQYLCTPTSYAPGTQTLLTLNSTTIAAVSSANINTGSFTAPPSGSVVVGVSFVVLGSAGGCYIAVGLCAHGTVTPVVGNLMEQETASSGQAIPTAYDFLVTGLTPGTSYNFDLVGAVTSGDTATFYAFGQSATGPVLGTGGRGGPVVMTVQAV